MEKQLKLLLTLCVLAVGGAFPRAWADTSLLPAGDGWTKVTSLSDVDGKYFVFVDNDNDLMLGLKKSGVKADASDDNRALFYQASANPLTDLNKLFMLKENGTGYAICNMGYIKYYLNVWYGNSQNFMTQDVHTLPNDWARVTLSYDDGSWTIYSTMHSKYLGPSATIADGVEVVEGKELAYASHFQVYAISKADYNAIYQRSNGSMHVFNHNFTLGTKTGWTCTAGNVRVGGYEIWHAANSSVSQTVYVPKDGKYAVSCQALHGEGESANSLLYAKSGATEATAQAKEATTSSGSGAFETETGRISADASLGRISVDISVTGNAVEIGFKQTAGSQWDVFSNFTVTPYISTIAETFDGEMEAGQWYAYTAGADDKVITAANMSDIVYTTDADQLATIAGTSISLLNVVAGTTYYLKSASTQSVSFGKPKPVLADGIYFFKVAAAHNGTSEIAATPAGKYLSRGGANGTHSTVDKYGLPIQVTGLASGSYSLSPADTKRFYFHDGSWDLWADAAVVSDASCFTIALRDGKYTISNIQNAGCYLKYNTSEENNEEVPVYDDGTGANAGPYILWTVETLAEHATAMQALKDAQAANVAAAAVASSTDYSSLSGITTVAALESQLSGYVQGDFVAPTQIESVLEKYQGDQTAGPETVYSNTIDITEPGLYKFSMQAFYRAASNVNLQALHTAGADFAPVVLFFGSAETQIKSIYDEAGRAEAVVASGNWGADSEYNGKFYPNCMAGALQYFKDDMYHNDVWLYVSEAGTYTYGVKYMGWACLNDQWFIYSPQSVTITSFAPAATAADYAALNTAIEAVQNAAWGFDEGEYAPYNNVGALGSLTAAQAIDQNAVNSKLLVQTAITSIALTANDSEVNGFRWTIGDYPTQGETTVNTGGFTFSNARISHNSDTNTGLNQLSDAMCLHVMSNGSGTYGSTQGYTLPLKANTVYALTFAYGGWGAVSGIPAVTVRNGSGTVVRTQSLATTSVLGNSTSSAWPTATVKFLTGEAGNYTVSFAASNARVAYGDLSLKRAVADDITLAETATSAPETPNYANVTLTRTLSADYWNTFCLPFDMSAGQIAATFGEGTKITQYSSENTANRTVSLEPATSIVAGVPYLIKPASTTVNPTINEVIVKQATGLTSGTDFKFIGVIEQTEVAAPEESDATWNYFLNTGGQMVKPSQTGNLKGMRAYFNIPAEAAQAGVRVIFNGFDDEPTSIDSIDGNTVGHTTEDVYSISGVKQGQGRLRKGFYIVGGKKIVIK